MARDRTPRGLRLVRRRIGPGLVTIWALPARDEVHRRACVTIAAAAARVAQKQEAPGVAAPEASTDQTPVEVAPGGCYTKSA